MKNYIALVSVVGTMILSGCAGNMPPPEEPVGVVAITSAELASSELAASPYERESLPSWWAEDPWGPSVHTRPASMAAEDPWSAAPPAPNAHVASTWGSGSAVAAEYGF